MESDFVDGIAVSPGITIGKVYLINNQKQEIDKSRIAEDEIQAELNKLSKALSQAEKSLHNIKKQTEERFGPEKAEIFEAHLMFLEDPEFITAIEEEIKENRLRAEAAVSKVVDQYVQLMTQLDDEYILARQADFKDVGGRLIKIIKGEKSNSQKISPNTIIVAKDLTPSDTAQLDSEKVLAFVTAEGSRTSHTSIMARSLGIPAVVGIGIELLERVKNGQEVIVDGTDGKVIIEPAQDTIKHYQNKIEKQQQELERKRKFVHKKAVTIDGFEIKVAGNIGNLSDLDVVLEQGADGVGLFRTEFLYMDREQSPSEEEQFEVYKDVTIKAGDKPVIIRTLDIGGDKELSYMKLPDELNPFLGYRAIRICLDRPNIFKAQLKAILRAANYGQIKIMFPMIAALEELSKAKQQLDLCKEELKVVGKEYNPNIEVGVMIETPAAVMIAEELAREADFFSIGTNDLIQYTIAVDRTNKKVSAMHSPYHPSVLRLINKVVKTAHRQGIPVGMCGEAASEEILIPFLLGIGLGELSMSAVSILSVKEQISKWSRKDALLIAEKVLELGSSKEIKDYLSEVIRKDR
ncbi:phosphoenolpyruvate--protein phosphotransferase [Halocella sp. SP3-1]|uniref:phosphoenolpyruvate--protein phosphotransferase n=1 Tax=Halocella sp. SP3-1 TaxID=2382161 RepID=UPI000F75E18B|nr:phosphoenolpyruvate--protein phosphotransferase [Halocella sp. SP3-1]AZO93503.1 phosphoenolpyruvate--protein phosphotransferase [Halocella sp. SP3-1]